MKRIPNMHWLRCEVNDIDCSLSVFGESDDLRVKQAMTLAKHTVPRLAELQKVEEFRPYLSDRPKKAHLEVKRVEDGDGYVLEVRVSYRMDGD
jgi:hypothetical protein